MILRYLSRDRANINSLLTEHLLCKALGAGSKGLQNERDCTVGQGRCAEQQKEKRRRLQSKRAIRNSEE